jgi:hypothetical protein
LRYFDALKTDHYELELGNANFAINAWSKLAIDAVAALDVQEYDTSTFGVLEVSISVYVQLLHAVFTRMHVLLCIFFAHCICHFICFQLKDEYKVKEICPRGNNKVVIIYIFMFMINVYISC